MMASQDKPPQATELPVNWPADIPYLAAPVYSPHLTQTHLSGIRTRPEDPSDPLPEIPRHLKPGPCPAVRVMPITDPNHPAFGQAGLFATRDLRPGELILPYYGEVHVGTAPFGQDPTAVIDSADKTNTTNTNNTSPDTDPDPEPAPEPINPNAPERSSNPSPSPSPSPSASPSPSQAGPILSLPSSSSFSSSSYYDYAQSDYDLWLDRDADVAVDAARAGNEARFVNDYRGVPLPGPSSGRRMQQQQQQQQQRRKRPNAEFKVVWDARIGEKCMAVYVLPAGKKAVGRARMVGIARGEEVLVNYGKGFWQGRREEEEHGEWMG
ncbi:hypothetical protein VTK26DRAFT_6862 [Humicola hyalothermophila]